MADKHALVCRFYALVWGAVLVSASLLPTFRHFSKSCIVHHSSHLERCTPCFGHSTAIIRECTASSIVLLRI